MRVPLAHVATLARVGGDCSRLSLLEVAERLGHTSPQTTADFYRHVFSGELRKLYLTGPEHVQKRLAELRDANLVNRDRRWL